LTGGFSNLLATDVHLVIFDLAVSDQVPLAVIRLGLAAGNVPAEGLDLLDQSRTAKMSALSYFLIRDHFALA